MTMDQPPKNGEEIKNEKILLEIEETLKIIEKAKEEAIWQLSQRQAIINPNDEERMAIADFKEQIEFFEREKRNLERRKAEILNTQNESPTPEPEKQPQEAENPEDVFGLGEETPANLQPELEIEPESTTKILPTETPQAVGEQTQPEQEKQQEKTEELKGEIKTFVEELKLEALLPKEFNKLTEAQQTKVIQDLKRRIVDIVKSDAQTQYAEKLKDRALWNSGILKIFEFVEKAQNALYKKEKDLQNTENEIFTRFIKQNRTTNELIKQDLEILTARTKGRDVVVENGKAYFNYFTGSSVLMAGEPNVHNFNEKTHGFVNMPYEWGQEKSGKNKKTYDNAKREYEETRKIILKQENITPKEKARLTQKMLETDNLVKMEQLLNTHPEFEKALKDFGESAKGLELIKTGKKFLKSITLEREKLMTAKTKTRWSTKAAAMFVGGTIGTTITAIAAPAIGGVVGYYRGRMRAKETLTERQIKARHGEKDESEEATNTEDVEKLNKRMEGILEAFEKAGTEEEKAKKLDQIKRRIEYTQNKIESKLVNFGDSKNALNNQFNLVNNLNKALIIAASLEQTTRKDIDARLKQFLSYKTKNINEVQTVFIKKQARNSALFGAGFATAGYIARWAGEHFGWWERTDKIKTETPKITKEVKPELEKTDNSIKQEIIPSKTPTPKLTQTPNPTNTPEIKTVEKIKPEVPIEKEIVAPVGKVAEVFKEESITFNKGSGGIQGIIDLRSQIKNHYKGDYSGAPQSVQEFMKEKNVMNLAKKLGFFDPDRRDGKESALIQEGSVLKFDEKGNLLFGKPDANGNVPVLEKYHGKMFDSDHNATASENTEIAEQNNTKTHTIGLKEETFPTKEGHLNPGTAENIYAPKKHSLGTGEEKSFFADKIEKIKNLKEQIEANIDAERTEGLSVDENLTPTDNSINETYNNTINSIFRESKNGNWATIRDVGTNHFLHSNNYNEENYINLKNYINKLIETTHQKPKNGIFGFLAETNEEYIKRAIKYATEHNIEM
ncbi:hypothetical protein IT399_00850 [Candidatus Nomurabacteria bacterium]|nr:hypothetical protein [Candidatus Nomurabacteria bacterium]